jgi:hypothetical protein
MDTASKGDDDLLQKASTDIAEKCLAQIERLRDLGTFANEKDMSRRAQLIAIRLAMQEYYQCCLESSKVPMGAS